ncbi:MAG: hypothetical protein ABI472_21570 [Ginsengibacter sp.]
MGKRKISIPEPAATSVAEIALFIESEGLPQFVDEAFEFFEKLSDERIEHKTCTNNQWKYLNYRCVHYKKKYVIAYLRQEREIAICDFVSAKLLK